MSHHRETVTAQGAPDAVGPYTHAVKSNGLVFCSGQVPLDPNTGKLVEGSIGDRTRRCLDNLAVVAAAAGAVARRRRADGHLRDRHEHVQGGQRGLRDVLRDRPARALDGRRGRAARSAPTWRSMPSSPSQTEVTGRRRRRGAARGRVDRAAHAGAVVAHDLRARLGRRRAEGGEPAARRAPSRSAASAPSSRRWATEGCANGVVAASAGNHAQALAAAARARGVHCEVFVPTDAPIAKVEAARGQGATIHVGGDSVDACVESALERADEAGMAFVHPFDDPDVVAGQGSLGLELLEDVPDLAKVVIPVGGGGLCAGRGDRGQVRAARGAGDRRAGGGVRALPGVAAARRAGARGLGAHDRRRDRGQAPGRDHAAAAAALGRRRRRRRRGRDRRGDGAADGALQARGRGRRRGRRRRAARRPGRRRPRGHDRRGALRRQRGPGAAGLDRPPPRDRGGPPPRAADARPRPARQPRDAARVRRRAGREHRRRLARARGAGPARARDGDRAGDRDPRPRARRRGGRASCATRATTRASSARRFTAPAARGSGPIGGTRPREESP